MVFWIHQLTTLPGLLYFKWRCRNGFPPGTRHRVGEIAARWGRLVCRLGGARITVEDHSGASPEEAVLLVSNHQGDFDIPVLLGFSGRHVGFVAKKELEGIPVVSGWMRLMGCIFLDRDDRRKQVKQLRETVDHLKHGLSMVIFPEGTRSRGPEMAPFAKGSLSLAEKAGVRIVPVTLRDTYTLKPKGSVGLPGGKATLILHPAFDPRDLPKEDRDSLHERVQQTVQSGLDG